jgi:serine O-acetyltransferase
VSAVETLSATRMISASTPDWSREHKRWFEWAPSRSLLGSIRAYQRHESRRGPYHALLRRWALLRHRFWGIVTGADIPVNCRIGGGLLLPHPNGIVIHPLSEIGPNCLLFQQVTIGMAHGKAPRLGGHVDAGAGAKILGPVRIGNHVVIGANAVVVRDLPDRCTAMGIPARVIKASPEIGENEPVHGAPFTAAGQSPRAVRH